MTPPAPRRLVLASSNPGKLAEFRALLVALPLALEAPDARALAALPEEGDDYAVNAAAKARAVAAASGLPALADDSGIEVRALGDRPGPRSARYGGPGLGDRERAQRLLDELAASGAADRRARFVCVAALALPDGTAVTERGECPGWLRTAASGSGGFGYDPIFEPEVDGRRAGCSMAELGEAEKNRLSHRGRALAALLPALRGLVADGPAD